MADDSFCWNAPLLKVAHSVLMWSRSSMPPEVILQSWERTNESKVVMGALMIMMTTVTQSGQMWRLHPPSAFREK
jgi:hypothetical protein